MYSVFNDPKGTQSWSFFFPIFPEWIVSHLHETAKTFYDEIVKRNQQDSSPENNEYTKFDLSELENIPFFKYTL